MHKIIATSTFILSIMFVCAALSCTPGDESANGDDGQGADVVENPYQAAESLAKRAVLYKLACMEGNLATFTALHESIADLDIPGDARNINEMWWTIDWEGTRLSPLPSTQIPVLEKEIFPLMALRLDATDEENGWVLFTLGFYPDDIKYIIAEAHTDWSPEMVDMYLGSTLKDCVQVWCIKIMGEWKILAQRGCTSMISTPPPPPRPVSAPGTGESVAELIDESNDTQDESDEGEE